MTAHYDTVVVGGGPAGMAAAASAAEQGKRVALVDDNFSPGGQIWRGEDFARGKNAVANAWYQRMMHASVTLLLGWRVFDHPQERTLRAENQQDTLDVQYGALILATGARERFLPFPGWTLPNVMGAGGLQALVKSGLSVHGKKIVIAGTGPLLIAVAANLKKHGANVLAICEQADFASLARFGATLLWQPQKINQGLSYGWQTRGIPFKTGCWPVAAKGEAKLAAIVLTNGKKQWEVACDYLACGYHLVPNMELAQLLGCYIGDGYVQVDDFQQTSMPNIYCAGEPTGIGGVERSLIEGEIAGLASAGNFDKARLLFPARSKQQHFAQALDECFALRSELRDAVNDDTLFCRCEDVAFGIVRKHGSWREAKLQTRCGMGPCQGRVCGPAAEFLLNWEAGSVRPPVFPSKISSLSKSISVEEIKEHQETK